MGGRNDEFAAVMKHVIRIFIFPFFRLESNGKENLPKKSAFILLPKHQRWEDIPLLSLAAPRFLYYIAKNELFKGPLSSWFLKALGGIPLNRQRPLESRTSLKGMIDLLRAGEGIVVFPEGTYYRNRMGPAHAGIVKLILSRLDLPFVPVGINYSRKGLRIQARIKFGKPLFADPGVPVDRFLDCVMKEIGELSGL